MTDRSMRYVLVLAALFNFSAAAMILFPESIGRFAELPTNAPKFFAWMLAMLIALFGAVYVWLAHRVTIDRPLVGVAALGKLVVFAVATVCLALGELSAKAYVPAVGDLIFALLFLAWLRSGAANAGR